MINPYSPNNTVVAYTGEKGSSTYGYSCTIPYGAGYLCGYKNSLKTNFIINGHYSGGGAPNYLYYDGHPGIDFKTIDQSLNGRIPVIAAANGIVHNGSNTYNTIYIDHENGYITYYLHLYNRTIKDGNRVNAGQVIGYAGDTGSNGSPHLHFEVKKNGILVDPYGWKGDSKDLYTKSTNIELWEYQDKTPPSSITNLKNITYKPAYINWTWKDPSTPDFYKVMVYINGIFKTNVSRGRQYYNLTGLMPDSYYKISTHTVDTAGNINKTWVNHTARTQSSSSIIKPNSLMVNIQDVTTGKPLENANMRITYDNNSYGRAYGVALANTSNKTSISDKEGMADIFFKHNEGEGFVYIHVKKATAPWNSCQLYNTINMIWECKLPLIGPQIMATKNTDIDIGDGGPAYARLGWTKIKNDDKCVSTGNVATIMTCYTDKNFSTLVNYRRLKAGGIPLHRIPIEKT